MRKGTNKSPSFLFAEDEGRPFLSRHDSTTQAKDARGPLWRLLGYGNKLTPGTSAMLMFALILVVVLATNHGGHDHDDEELTEHQLLELAEEFPDYAADDAEYDEDPEDPGDGEGEDHQQQEDALGSSNNSRPRTAFSPDVTLPPLSITKHEEDAVPEGPRVPDATFCGKTLHAEPDQRTQSTKPTVSCRCKDECDGLDFPAVTYILKGYKDQEDLQSALEWTEAYHLRNSPGASKEVIVHSSVEEGGLSSYGSYLGAHQALKPDVSEKKKAAQPNNGLFVMRSLEQPGDDAQWAALARMANAPKVVRVGPGLLDVKAAPRAAQEPALTQERSDVVSRGSQDCGQELDFAVLIQYFKRPAILPKLFEKILKLPGRKEVLINNDSASEVQDFLNALKNTRFTMMIAGDIHEIRGYNRLGKLAHAKLLVVLKDGDVPTTSAWMGNIATAFSRNKQLGVVGGYTGIINGGPLNGKYGTKATRIPFAGENGQKPLMFVTSVKAGPLVIRQDLFWETGMFNINYSCVGDPGIHFDSEFSLRSWWSGYQVGLMRTKFQHRYVAVTKSGARAKKTLYKRRGSIEKRNNAYYMTTYGPDSPRQFHWRQGAPGKTNSKSSRPAGGLKGVGALVYEANNALKASSLPGGNNKAPSRPGG